MRRIHLAIVTGLASLTILTGSASAAQTYQIKEGDSLSKIAAAHNTDWRRLWFKNLYIINPDLIYTGKTLEIPAADEVLAERALPSAPVATPAPVAVAPKPAPVPRPAPQPAPAYGSGCDWLAGQLRANGIAEGDIPAAISIASRESGCRQGAVNRSSGACNVFQELPCGKWGGSGNLSAHIRGADNYAKSRYGGWWGAYRAWQAKHWW